MDESDDFREQLLRRIDRFRASEDKVRARHNELAVELEGLAARRQAAEGLFRDEFGEVPAPEPEGQAPQLPLTQSEQAQPPEGPFTGRSWIDAISAVLEDAGPLHVKEIWQRLQDGGFRTNARDPLRSIVAVSIRSKPRIVRVGANRYGLSGALDRPERDEGEEVVV
jgi:hypothetical protein